MLQTYQPQPEKSISRTFRKFRKPPAKMGLQLSHERSEQHLATLDKAVTDPQAEPDIPAFFKRHVDKDPFANVHVKLRVGPLIIENGASL